MEENKEIRQIIVNGLKYKLCKYCNQKFLWSSSCLNRVYCSDKCSKKYWKKRNGVTEFFEEKRCINCEKKFLCSSSRPNQQNCSKLCGNEYNNKKLKLIFQKHYLKLRFDILKRDNFTCQYCGRDRFKDNIKINIDHINPKVKGGLNKEDNLITSCVECNLGKFDVLLEQRIIDKLKLKIKENELEYRRHIIK